jgi:c-di-GMP-binding flagellar brake protein YcgR
MLFRKNDRKERSRSGARSGAGKGDRRGQYRVRTSKQQPISATLVLDDADLGEGECIDLSIGGAWVEFSAADVSGLAAGDLCVLRIRAALHPDAVHASSRVVSSVVLDDDRVRVGFQFTDRIELYAQLDEIYAPCFNRRRHVRASSDAELRVPVTIAWRNGSIEGTARDLSEGGLGVEVPLGQLKALERVEEVDLSFRLPEEPETIACRGTIRGRVNLPRTSLLGIEFGPDGGIEGHLQAVARCVEKQRRAVEARNAKLGKKSFWKRAG